MENLVELYRIFLFLFICFFALLEDLDFYRVRKSITNYALIIIPFSFILHGNIFVYTCFLRLIFCLLYLWFLDFLTKKLFRKSFGLADYKLILAFSSLYSISLFLQVLILTIVFGFVYALFLWKKSLNFKIPFVSAIFFANLVVFLKKFMISLPFLIFF